MEKENIIFGIRAIIEAIQAGTAVDKVFIQKEIAGELMKDLMKVMKRANINFSYVPVEKLNRLTPNNHQGAVASISPIGFMELEHLVESTMESGKQPLFLILDQISDARNFGAIIRTAECTGVNGIIVQKAGSAPVNGDTVKTSAGAVFNVPICKVEHIKDAADGGWEGLMLRKNTIYKGKRSSDILKVKSFVDAEYTVVSVENSINRVIVEGKEIEEEMLKNVVIEHKGFKVDVGSGFSQEQRRHYFKNPEEIIGKTITVQYFEETYNDKGGISLRFPTVKVVHGDKREV